MPSPERNNSKEDEKSCSEDTLKIIIQKITNQDRVLDEMRKNVEALNQLMGSNFRSIQHIRSQLMFLLT